ncbi:MAG: hypothetical protein R2851_03065 [Caldilineaceae bacterium]
MKPRAKADHDLGDGQWDIPELRTLLEQILPENKVFTGYEVEHEFQGIGRRTACSSTAGG